MNNDLNNLNNQTSQNNTDSQPSVQNNSQSQNSNTNLNNQPTKNNNTKTLLIIGIVLVVAFFGFKMFNNSNNSSNGGNGSGTSNQQGSSGSDTTSVYKTVSAIDLANNNGTNYYKEYLDKKVTITNLVVSIDEDGISIGAPGLSYFSVSCNNKSSLNLHDGDEISITGTVENSTFTKDGYFVMKNCSVN